MSLPASSLAIDCIPDLRVLGIYRSDAKTQKPELHGTKDHL